MIVDATVTPVESPIPRDEDLVHWYHIPAPRNVPVVTVMCCGLPAALAGEMTQTPRPGEIWCPMCVIAVERENSCACYG